MKREKIELENTLEKEQESLVNRLWKRMEKLETDKKLLQSQIQQTVKFYFFFPRVEIIADNIVTRKECLGR